MQLLGEDSIQDWKLFLVQEFCEAGSLRKAIDSGMFLSAAKKPKLVRPACMPTATPPPVTPREGRLH
jgi:hypothetical protein